MISFIYLFFSLSLQNRSHACASNSKTKNDMKSNKMKEKLKSLFPAFCVCIVDKNVYFIYKKMYNKIKRLMKSMREKKMCIENQ